MCIYKYINTYKYIHLGHLACLLHRHLTLGLPLRPRRALPLRLHPLHLKRG